MLMFLSRLQKYEFFLDWQKKLCHRWKIPVARGLFVMEVYVLFSAIFFEQLHYVRFDAGDIVSHNIPHGFRYDSEIVMYQYMPHLLHKGPREFWVCRLEFFSEFIGGLSNHLDVIDGGIEGSFVGNERAIIHIFCELFDMVYGHQHVFQSAGVTRGFSHISVFFLCWQSVRQRAIGLPPQPNPLHGAAAFQGRES